MRVDNDIKSHRRDSWISQWNSHQRGKMLLDSYIPDEITAVETFISMLNLEWTSLSDAENMIINTMNIVNYDTQLFDEMWQTITQHKWYRNKQLRTHLIKIANDIIDHDEKQYELNESQRASLNTVIRGMRSICFRNNKSEKMIFAQADMAVIIIFHWSWGHVGEYYKYALSCMNSNEKYQFLTWMIKYNDLYQQTLKSNPKRYRIKWDRLWRDLVRVIIKSIHDNQKLVNFFKQYRLQVLDLLVDNNEKNLDWLIDIVTKHWGSKDQRDFALMMIDFINMKAKTPRNLVTKKHIEFIQMTLDLKWVSLPANDQKLN